jgi:glucose-6-phosphate isomerase
MSQVLDGTGPGHEWFGWRRILKRPDLEEINQIKQLAARVGQDADVFIVCGIGGSYLGSRAVIDALNGLIPEEKPEIIYAGHQISGRYLEQLIEYLNKPNINGNRQECISERNIKVGINT